MVMRQWCVSKVTELHDPLHFCKLQCLVLLSLWMQNVQKIPWFSFQKFLSATVMPKETFQPCEDQCFGHQKQTFLLNNFLF